MSAWIAVGWIGNAFYFARFLVQWWLSERAGRSVTPRVFWWLSLGGCLFLGSYSAWSGEVLLLPGFLINGAIYVRNVFLSGRGERRSRLGPLPAAGAGLLAALALWITGAAVPREGLAAAPLWLGVGIVGQAVWASRFLLQWWFSERAGRSYFPRAFWWYSLLGAVCNVAYTTHAGDAVLIASYLPTPLYPIRNIMLEARHTRQLRRAGSSAKGE